jgi:soluble lytic murein transglycosylase-like protein
MRRLVPVVFFCVCAQAGEYAVLANGFRLHADRHEQTDGLVKLYTGSGRIEMPAADVVAFEPDGPAVEQAKAPKPAPVVGQALCEPDARELVKDAARYAELPEALVESVARAESAFHTNAVSKKGALGVMQLMPETAAALRADPKDVAQNIYAGALYLRELLLEYNGDVVRAVAAYNAGPGAVSKYHGLPPYAETHTYVNRVIGDYLRKAPAAGVGR